MASEREHSGSQRTPSDTSADGTHFRTPAAETFPDNLRESRRLTSESFHSPGKSIRLHARPSRGSLALKLAIPVIAAVLLGLVVSTLVIRDRFTSLQIGELREDAANGAFMAGIAGRLLLTHRDKFLQENPDYLEGKEWRTGDHWLVSHGFVGESDWVEATGFQLNEYAPVQALDRAGQKVILSNLNRWMNNPANETELVALYIMDAAEGLLASSVSNSFRIDPNLLKGAPVEARPMIAGDSQVFAEYLADFEPEPVVRGIARIMDVDDPGRWLGSVIVVLRTHRHIREQTAFLYLSLGLGVLMTAFMSFVCWYAARRVTVPLRRLASDMQAMAEGDFARRSIAVGTDELGQLAQAFNSMAERLRVARLNERETSRLESDLTVAKEIQNNLLPPQTPRVRGLDIHTAYRPAREIGGDYFDFLPVDNQHMGIVIADASGKSIPAALVMSTTRAILRFVAPGSSSAAETLARVNAILSVDIPKGMFVTAYYVILDPVSNTLLCSSAGHTPLLIARADGSVELMNPGGIALGFDNGPIFQRSIREQRVKLEQGDRMLLYTDGVVECVNPSNEEYSDRRLREFLRRNRDLSSHDFVGALLADLDRHRGAAEMRDDTTIVTFKVL